MYISRHMVLYFQSIQNRASQIIVVDSDSKVARSRLSHYSTQHRVSHNNNNNVRMKLKVRACHTARRHSAATLHRSAYYGKLDIILALSDRGTDFGSAGSTDGLGSGMLTEPGRGRFV